MAKKIKNELDDIINEGYATEGNLFFMGGAPQQQQQQSNGSPDFGNAIGGMGPWGAAISAVSGAGDQIGQTVGGDTGDFISGMFKPEKAMALYKQKGITTGQKALGTLVPGLGNVFVKNAQEKEQKALQFGSDIKQRNSMLGIKAYGGDLTEFNTGGSHEQNPYQGIPQGIAPDGTQNKVEQGETKWQDYIFSDRLLLDDTAVKQANLPKSITGKTFAHASKYLNKLSKERPNDPISKDTVKDHMNRLISANDNARNMEEQSLMAKGGRLYGDGDELDLLMNKGVVKYNASDFISPEIQPEAKTAYNAYLPLDMKKQDPKSSKTAAFMKDEKNLRYAPILFNALAGAGLFGKSPSVLKYHPSLIGSVGRIGANLADEERMRNAVDASFQAASADLANASAGSTGALRAGLSALNSDYMSSIGKAFIDANIANNATKTNADQFNVQMQGNIAAQNAHALNHAGMYNTQSRNQKLAQDYDTQMSYLAKSFEGVGDIGYEARMAQLMPKLYGYDQYGNYLPKLHSCGGRMRMKKYKK